MFPVIIFPMDLVRKVFFFLVDTVQTFLLLAAIFLTAYVFLFRPYEVNGQSMFPNFHDKEVILTNLIGLRFEDPKKGDVVVFVSPKDKEKNYIKRVIGTKGDEVSIRGGNVYVNNKKLDESVYLKEDIKTYSGVFLREGQDVVVPEGKFFVLGDNRGSSSDSREWGFVQREAILGESIFVYWPLNQIRGIKNPFE